MRVIGKIVFILTVIVPFIFGCKKNATHPNVLFILMDDLGYGQFGIYNDTITTADFNPFYVHLVDSLEGYSLEKALEFSKIAAPTLSSLAKEGIIFTNAYTSSSICGPSRLGIATGRLQCKWGIYTNNDCEQHGLVPGTLLAENIHRAGYATAHIGKWHIGKRNDILLDSIRQNFGSQIEMNDGYPLAREKEIRKRINECGYWGSVIDEHNPLNNGFDYYYGYNYWASQFYNSTIVWENFTHQKIQKEYNTDTFTDKAIHFMDESLLAGKPFYVQLHYHAVHDSLEPRAPDKYLKNFDSGSFRLNNFFAHIYGVDYNVNRIIEYLKSKGEYENTLIMFTSDNGAMAEGAYNGNKTGSPLPANTPFAGHKGTYFQGGIRVPMFASWPAGIKKANVSHSLVSTMDILPTAIAVARGKIPDNIDGKSLVPFFGGAGDTLIHDHLIWAGLHSYSWGYLIQKTEHANKNEIRHAPFGWVVIKDNYMLRFTGNRVPGIYLDFMDGKPAEFELYNLLDDPAETHDLSRQMPEKVIEMAEIYFDESKSFLPPSNWKIEKWEELVNSKGLLDSVFTSSTVDISDL